MDAPTFIRKWQRAELSERAASQEHFLDLCRLLGQPTPAEHDATGAEYTFERGVTVAGPASAGSKGERGFADVWWKGKFGWEYKRKGKYSTLDDAYRQLCQYREALENPPLLVVSDIARIEIRTNFTGFKTDLYQIELESLTDEGRLSLLRRVFTDPLSFRPDETAEQVTEKAAKAIGEIAQGLRARGHDPHDAAHFLMKAMFCLFAEDVELLPKGLFERMLQGSRHEPARLREQMDRLFAAMRTGGDFGLDRIAHFNGGLFDESGAIELTEDEIESLVDAADKDWGAVEPSVFGTLFERSLDPDKRAQIGAHYTSRDDIMLVVEPVIVRPLRREWGDTREKIEAQIERRRAATTAATKRRADAEIGNLLNAYQHRLAEVRVLDPACGSGNFLYVAIQQLLALEKEVILYAARPEIAVGLLPRVRPTQLHGIEINTYAAELAQVVIWIGYLQWMRDNGFNAPRNPILEPIETIENRDAILAWADETGGPIAAWREGAVCRGKADWPEADFIVGNPPFLGAKFMRSGLGDEYTEAAFGTFDLPNFSDLCCYWFDQAVHEVNVHGSGRFGLLATQGIRGGSNREVLDRIAGSMHIFDAWSDRDWVLDGAHVHVSIVCASSDASPILFLNGGQVMAISTDLREGVDTTTAQELRENTDICYLGIQFNGPFDFPWTKAREILALGGNPNGQSAIEVLARVSNGADLSRRTRAQWCVSYPADTPIEVAAGYASAFGHVDEVVRPMREKSKATKRDRRYWLPLWPRPEFMGRVQELRRYLVTPAVSKHRLFVWMAARDQVSHAVVGFTRCDDLFFGLVHSSVHELWARRQGTQLREAESGFRYTPTTCFETFPLPWAPGSEPGEGGEHRGLHDAIAAAAKTLDEQRERWLNPPEWVAEIAERVDAADDFADVARVSGEEARRLIRQSAIDAASAKDPRLKKRTLTNLYNERPTWLRLAHEALDRAVLAAYAAIDPEGGWSSEWADVFVETGAGQPLPEGPGGEPHPLAERRAEIEQAILAGLLRLNRQRSGAT